MLMTITMSSVASAARELRSAASSAVMTDMGRWLRRAAEAGKTHVLKSAVRRELAGRAAGGDRQEDGRGGDRNPGEERCVRRPGEQRQRRLRANEPRRAVHGV